MDSIFYFIIAFPVILFVLAMAILAVTTCLAYKCAKFDQEMEMSYISAISQSIQINNINSVPPAEPVPAYAQATPAIAIEVTKW